MHDPSRGLTASEAQERLRQFGPNASGETEDHRLRTVVASVASEPMFLLLLAAATVYLVVGDLGEGLLLGFFAFLSVGLVMWQQYRGETALQALRSLAVRHVRVVRDGVIERIPSSGVVPGDLVLVAEGERIAADAVLLEGNALQVDESLLTGESVPVPKRPDSTAPDHAIPGAEDPAHLFAGTLVVAGHGVGRVTSTGRHTQMGRIGTSLAAIETEPTPLQRELGRLVRRFGWLAMALCGCLVLWYGLARQDWVQGLLSALAFAMAMLPEEFPMVLTIFIGMAAWRMARLQVLARRPAVVEALGATTVLCVDKTGTLTENRQRLQWLAAGDAGIDLASATSLPPAAQALLEHAVLASRRGGVDPLDLALLERGDVLIGAAQRHAGWQLAREYALTPELPAMTQVWSRGDGVQVVATKGAPEAVATLCRLDAIQRREMAERVGALADRGLRVLAVAGGVHDGQTLPDRQGGLTLTFLGLVGFEDPLREEVPRVVRQARAAGIAVMMITGDHVATAFAIARQAGIDTRRGALTGDQLTTMGPEALRQVVREVRVFARILPHQKLALVQALQAEGEVVAMTGDGVNDAPALKAAHIGIAMGKRGTDVAREAAGLVLLDEKLTSILAGVRAGRRTFDNLRHAATYILAVHVPIAGLALLPLLVGVPPLLLPAHVVLTEMVVDPMCSFAFEGVAARDDIMRRPPRPARDALVGRATLRQGVLEGVLLLAAVLAVAFLGLRWLDEPQARTLSVVALTTGNLLLVWVNTGPHGRRAPAQRALITISAGSLVVVLAAILWEPLRSLLQFAVPPSTSLLAAAATAAVSVLLASALTGALERGRGRAVGARARADG